MFSTSIIRDVPPLPKQGGHLCSCFVAFDRELFTVAEALEFDHALRDFLRTHQGHQRDTLAVGVLELLADFAIFQVQLGADSARPQLCRQPRAPTRR